MAAPRQAGAGTLWLAGWLLVAPVSQAWAQGVPAEARGRVVDRVVAIIEGRVLSLSELEFEARVALIQRGGVQALDVPLDEQTLRGALELVINQRVQVLNADRLQAFPAEPSEVEARLEVFRVRVGGAEALERFLARSEVDLEGLKAVLARGLRAERVLDSRIRLRAQVGETEVRRYYEQHSAEHPGDYETVRDTIREKLFRERYAALAVEELAQVRASAQVRRVAPFTREAKR
ncbi:hypothetical protein MYSTI_04644 [Myxococcus stipitatus DSM 14675]|uniref:Peptidylprolyl isomerase n=1 Tax=Myxococcus stipitatus (strain DSM 14675 / JCM 12634 / Mx s8) TaxID=1278073 RepID=L7UAL0_MYXSD|nr:hypothetical protein [Myxococcus stipitatus]AGC45936.1 hypothetical protein MYSTI_04644 [Myxococcus stipitatus DSM 14675]